jgi:hypothetical protein
MAIRMAEVVPAAALAIALMFVVRGKGFSTKVNFRSTLHLVEREQYSLRYA